MILPLLAAALAETRESRLAMGTVTGITVRDDAGDVHGDIAAAYAAIERWEAVLSEWRPDSATARLNATGSATLPDIALFDVARAVETASNGAFSLTFAGGTWGFERPEPGVLALHATGKLGLGGILKGWLADRAAEVLAARGRKEFLVDAAGDLVARGRWEVELPALGLRACLHDGALSSSGDQEQPGHLRDPRTGEPATCSRAVSVVASDGAHADALATAAFVACDARFVTSFDARAVRLDADGELEWSRGARRSFHR